MAPTMGLNNNNVSNPNSADSPLSKTYQYRKIMKPMLERKRRARINRCLDELKELITGAIQNSDGEENITKLEKADILELTVRHFHNLKRQNKFYVKPESTYADRFREGFKHCAKEVTKFLYQANQNRAGEQIVVHLNECIRRLEGPAQNNNNNNNNNNIHLNNNYLQNKNSLLESQPFMPPPQAPRVPPNYIIREPNENQHVPAFLAPMPRDQFVHPDQVAKDLRQAHFNQKDQDPVWRPW